LDHYHDLRLLPEGRRLERLEIHSEKNEDTAPKNNKDTENNEDTEDKKATATSERLPVYEEIARHIKFLKLTCEMLQLQAETEAAQHTKKT
jgi:hypothetical protein